LLLLEEGLADDLDLEGSQKKEEEPIKEVSQEKPVVEIEKKPQEPIDSSTSPQQLPHVRALI